MSKHWTSADMPSLSGKRVLITGANSGIGYVAALKLARKGAHVLLACRDRKRGEDALRRLEADSPGTHAELVMLDLSSLASVRSFAAQELALAQPLHLLINNAGVMAPPKRIQTADGFELQFATNVLGHFALTGLLLPALERAAADSSEPPRIVTIASIAHKRGSIHFDDLQSTKSYSPNGAYQQSKLANLLLALELDRRLRAAHSRILSIAAHPGVASTNILLNPNAPAFERTVRNLAFHIISVALNTDADGALPTLYAATSVDAKAGGYYGPQSLMETRGHIVGQAKVSARARDEAAAARLWQVCEQLSGVQYLSS